MEDKIKSWFELKLKEQENRLVDLNKRVKVLEDRMDLFSKRILEMLEG